MEIRNSFELAVPPERAYPLLLDLEQVVPCMPGATLGDEREGGARGLAVAVKLGPMRFNYDGEVRIEERDDGARTAVLAGSARETRGQGAAEARVTMSVAPSGGGSEVTSVADLRLSGRAAQMGHGMVQTVAEQLIGDMSRCIAAKLASNEAAPADGGTSEREAAPVSGIRLALRAIAARLRRLFRRS
jgi:carbon monoxide dehydrogenase subunit G